MQRIEDRRIRRILQRMAPAEAARALLQIVLPERLVHNPWARSIGLDAESMDQLTREVMTYGLREPLLARRLPGDHYQVLIGGRLLEAARRVGMRTLPVIVAGVGDDIAMTIAVAEALTRERISPWEIAEGLAEFVETLAEAGQDTSPARIAGLLDHSPEWVQRLLFIAERLSPSVLEKAGVSVHDMHVLTEAALLHATDPDDPDERARRLSEVHVHRR